MPIDPAKAAGDSVVTTAGRPAAMRFIMIAVLIDMMSIGLMIPVFPQMVEQFTHSQDDQAFRFGAMMFAFGIANYLGAPVLGALSDRFGRRSVLFQA